MTGPDDTPTIDPLSAPAAAAAAYDHAAGLVDQLVTARSPYTDPASVPVRRVEQVAQELRARAVAQRNSAPQLRKELLITGARLVLAEHSDGLLVAVGPAYTDGGEARLREAVTDAGWHDAAVVEHLSLSVFRGRYDPRDDPRDDRSDGDS